MSFTPYFMFSIGDYSSVYEGKNLSVLSATITRQAKSDGKPALVSFEINLRDIDRKLESELIYQYAKQATVEEGSNIKIEENVLPQIEFEYGIPKISESPKYKGSITKVGYEIENRYISLTLEGTASSVIDDYNNTGEVKVYKDMDIHEIVADIANMAGWEIGEITDCEPVYETNDSYSDKKVYRLEKGQGFREFIIENLIPEAKELETGIGDFRLYFRVEDGKERVYFTPSKYSNQAERPVYYIYTKAENDIYYNAKSFNPTIDIAPRLAGYSSGLLVVETLDEDSGEIISVEVYDNKNKEATGNKSITLGKEKYYSISSGNKDDIEKFLRRKFDQNNIYFNAELTVIGNAKIQPQDEIEVISIINNEKHFTSGIFKVLKVVDTIEQGIFESQLTLFNNAGEIGNTEEQNNVS